MKKYILILLLSFVPLPAHALTEAELITQLQGAFAFVSQPQQILSFDVGEQQATLFEVRAFAISGDVLEEHRVRFYVVGSDAFYAGQMPQQLTGPSPQSFSQAVNAQIQANIDDGTIKFGEIVGIQGNRALVDVVMADGTRTQFLLVQNPDGTFQPPAQP